jgi:hypothetical protein
VLVPTTLTAPEFPYTFGFIPAGVGSTAVRQWLLAWPERTTATALVFGDALTISVSAHQSIHGNAGEDAVDSAVTVNGEPATLWTNPGGPSASLVWQQDGLYFIAGTDGTVSPDDLVRFADSMASGSTPGTAATPIDAITGVGLPPGYAVYEWNESGVCARPEQGDAGRLCLTILAEAYSVPHLEDFTIDGQPAYTQELSPGAPTLVVERADGLLVMVGYGSDAPDPATPTTEDLVAIYRSITFEQ